MKVVCDVNVILAYEACSPTSKEVVALFAGDMPRVFDGRGGVARRFHTPFADLSFRHKLL